MRRHVTQSLLDRLPPENQFVRDDRLAGFGVRVTDKGRISFIVEGRIRKGSTVRLTLGKHPNLTVQEARGIAREQLALMDQGIDPRQHREEQRQEAQRQATRDQMMGVTLSEMLERYLRARTLTSSTEKDYKNTVSLVFADWMDRPIRSISRSDIENRFIWTRDNRGKATAARSMRYLSAIMNWAMAEEVDGERLISENPCQVLTQKRYDRTVAPRERYLSDKEISQLFHYIYTERSWPTREYVREHGIAKQQPDGSWKPVKDGVTDQGLNYILLLLYTGLRKGEALTLRWEDVDWEKRFFLVRDTKNHSDHVVPFSNPVQAVLRSQATIANGSEWVFPGNSESGHMTEPKSQLHRICKATGLDFNLHDLRRTFATHARIHGSDFDLVKRALNHKSGDITDRYIQGTLELIRPVFEKVARGYMIYHDGQLVWEIENPEEFQEALEKHAEEIQAEPTSSEWYG